ncbi:MBL fold metallo-hydrolase [Bdellovibrio bacteriovorus]
MKAILIALAGLFVTSGCQSFKYYDPAKPHHGEKSFLNNYDNSEKQSFWKWQWERLTSDKPKEPEFEPEVLKVDSDFLKSNQSQNTFTWIGHATALLQTGGANILTDPVFSERVSPVSFAGPRRMVKVPLQMHELPPIDAVVVSHGHYDHLDLPTLKELAKRSSQTLFLVPLGNAELLQGEGIKNVKELDWWDHVTVKGLTITFTPAQHWSARSLFDRNQTLWGGWHVRSGNLSFLYTGDTGYSKDFLDIAEKLGSVDIAFIPIGAYEPRWFMKQQHVNPEEAVQIHLDVKAKLSIGGHWGTFRLSDETMVAPVQDLEKALVQKNVKPSEFRVMKHGEILVYTPTPSK